MPHPQKTFPEVRCLIQDRSAVPKGGTGGFTVACMLSRYIGTGGGSSTGPISGATLNPLASRAWNDPGQISRIGESLEFVRFAKDGTVTFGASSESAGGEDEFCGFCLRAKETPFDAKGPGDADNNQKPVGVESVPFEPIMGIFRSVSAGLEANARALVNTGADGRAKVRTGTFVADRGFRWIVTGHGLIGNAYQGVVPHVLLTWGNEKYGVVLPDGKKPQLLEKVNGAWAPRHELKGAPTINLRGGRHVVRVFTLGGRGVLEIDGLGWHWSEIRAREDSNERGELVPITWPEGVATYDAVACRVRIESAKIGRDGSSFAQDRQIVLHLAALSYEHQGATATGNATGWLGSGGATVTLLDLGRKAEVVVTLFSDGTNAGTPVINKITGIFPDSPYDPGSGTVLDVSKAVRRVIRNEAYPPHQAGADLTLTFDRVHLDLISNNWGAWIQEFCVVEYSERWHYDSGPPGPWTHAFKGYGLKPSLGTLGPNKKSLTLTCLDPIVRLQAPASAVTHQHPPLDVFWLEKLRRLQSVGGPSPEGPYNPYDPQPTGGLPQNIEKLAYLTQEGVRDILWLFLGPEAQRLYVNLPEGLPPIFASDKDLFGYVDLQRAALGGTPPSVQDWARPAPFREDALSWIYSICKDVNAIFFYGYVPGGDFSAFPRPTITTMAKLLENRPTHAIYDTVYDTLTKKVMTPEAINKIMTEVEMEFRPETNINHVVATSTGFFGDAMAGMLPVPRIAEASLPDSDINSEAKSWRRTHWIDSEEGGAPGGIEGLVLYFMSLIKGTGYHIWPTVTLDEGRCYDPARGDMPITIGDLVQFNMNGPESDGTIGLNGNTYRVGSVSHELNLSESSSTHRQVLGLRPRAASGL